MSKGNDWINVDRKGHWELGYDQTKVGVEGSQVCEGAGDVFLFVLQEVGQMDDDEGLTEISRNGDGQFENLSIRY